MPDLHFEGSWYIHYTNFPMWLKGDKLTPSLNYRWIEHKGQPALQDLVIYSTRQGKERIIQGISTPIDSPYQDFLWRGKGWLSWVTSRWGIIGANPEQGWMVIAFLKTWFTPDGVDVVSKHPTLDPTANEAILAFVDQLPIQPPLKRIR